MKRRRSSADSFNAADFDYLERHFLVFERVFHLILDDHSRATLLIISISNRREYPTILYDRYCLML